MVALELTSPNIAFVGCGRVEVALQCFLMKSFSSKGLVKLLFLVVRPKDGAVLPVEYEIPARSDVRMCIVKLLQNLCRIAYGVLKNKYPPAFLFGFIPIHKEHRGLETMLHQVGQPLLGALAREREIL